MNKRPKIVIVGGGFAGLCAARGLAKADASVVLIDRSNHHLFQPLLYQVATGALSPANIAAPLRALVKRQKNTEVLLGQVDAVRLGEKKLDVLGRTLPFDYLIVATGSSTHYFGNDSWSQFAPGLKTIEDARELRHRIFTRFEQAELEPDPEEQRRLLTFVVVGGGPTGVEMAGAIAEVAQGTLRGEFRNVDPTAARVLLMEGQSRILGTFSEGLSAKATSSLEGMGVEVLTGTLVQAIEPKSVTFKTGDAVQEVQTETVVWAAGVRASELGVQLAEQSGAKLDRGGRVHVNEDCSLETSPDVFVLGDLAHHPGKSGQPLPGLAPVAMQQGRYVARLLLARLKGRSIADFSYRDRGSMATIGRKLAVAQVGSVGISGFSAWLAWLFIHLMYLAEFENRLLVLVQWGWSYFTKNRTARLISRG